MDRETAKPQIRSLPGDRAKQWIALHHEHAAASTYVYEFVWDITADATGPFCTDVDGNVLLDFTSHVAAAPLGYNHPRVAEKLEAFDLPDPGKIAGQDFYVSGGWPPEDPEFPGPTQLMDRLTDLTSHYGLDTVFLSNSGAEAVENAIKICYDSTGGTRAITFEGAFHGRTLGALSLNRSKSRYRRRFPEINGITDVPYCRDTDCTAKTCECGFFPGRGDDARSLLRKKIDPEAGHVPVDELAYIILEPIQGEGGYRIPSDRFIEEIAAVAAEHEIPIIADEIQTGLGRTGERWAVDHYPIEPDVIASAKGLRVGATIAREETFPAETGRISSTWGAGDIVAALQGVVTIEVIEAQNLLRNATERGRQLVELLEAAILPGTVDIRGKGLMIAVECDTKARRKAVIEACLKRGLLTLGCGQRSIRLLPPLDVTAREIALGAELFTDAVRAVAEPRET